MKKYKHKATSIEEVSDRNFITESEIISVNDVYLSKNQIVDICNNGTIASTKEGIGEIQIKPKSLVNLLQRKDGRYKIIMGFKTDGTHNTSDDYNITSDLDQVSIEFNEIDKGFAYMYAFIGSGVASRIKPKTTYTFFLDLYVKKSYRHNISVVIQEGNATNALTATEYLKGPFNAGWSRLRCTLKSKDTLETELRKGKAVYLGFPQNDGLSENTFIFKNAMLIEGDIPFADYPGYFEGYTSCLEQPTKITSHASNYLDITKLTSSNAIILDIDPSKGYIKFKKNNINQGCFIEFKNVLVERNTNYKISYDVFSQNQPITLDTYVYSENDTFYSKTPLCIASNPTFNTNECNKIDLGVYAGAASDHNSYEIFNLRLTKGSDTKEFEPYRCSTLILDALSLKELPNGVRDTIEGNKLTRRVGKVVLNGTETGWHNMNETLPSNSATLGFLLNSVDKGWNIKHINKHFTDLFVNYGDNAMYNTGDFEKIGTWSHGGTINIRILKGRGINGVDSFKKWLSENPVTLYYELDHPTVEYIDTFRIGTYDGITHIKTDSNFFIPLQVTTEHSVVGNINNMKNEVIIQNNKLSSLKEIQFTILNNLI